MHLFPKAIWDVDTFHRNLMKALDDSFYSLSESCTFGDDWRERKTYNGTKTLIRQAPLLGCGAPHRDSGGFWLFAKRYTAAEGRDFSVEIDRCGFERYLDFSFCTAGDWYKGEKQLLMIAEVESNAEELIGELSGLISIRCQHKYLFVAGRNTLKRLTDYCEDEHHAAIDWEGTTYFVIEIPETPSIPSSWATYRADVNRTGDRLVFRSCQ